jgi:propane 2-monooxygenase small subunit
MTRDDGERRFAWYEPHRRRATLYEDVTVDTQPSVQRHLPRDWPVRFADGRGTWWDGSTALRSQDWYGFRDPGELWERPFYQRAAAGEMQIERAVRLAASGGLLADFEPAWVEFLRGHLQVLAFVEHALWFPLATAARDCLSDSIATCVCLQAATKQRSAQAIVLLAMDLEPHHGSFPIEAARDRFLTDERWQPARRCLERLAAVADWGELIVAANLCVEPLVGTLLRREVTVRAASAHGDTVAPTLAQVALEEADWAREWSVELVRFAQADARHGTYNRDVVAGWLADWVPAALEAAAALAELVDELPAGDGAGALERTRCSAAQVLEQAGHASATEVPA